MARTVALPVLMPALAPGLPSDNKKNDDDVVDARSR